MTAPDTAMTAVITSILRPSGREPVRHFSPSRLTRQHHRCDSTTEVCHGPVAMANNGNRSGAG